jgi:glutathione S-transferase
MIAPGRGACQLEIGSFRATWQTADDNAQGYETGAVIRRVAVNPNQLIGAQVSLYTGKVRAYLDYKAIPYVEVAATREVYRDVILPRTGVRFIPVLISEDDVAVQDSSAIIDFLEARYPERCVYPETPIQRWIARLLEVYADEWLVIPAMHYRWNVPENRAFAIEEFGRLSTPDVPLDEQRAIGERLAGPFAGALPSLGAHAHMTAAIETSYLEMLSDFDRHLALHPYLLGARPSIGDFAFYGPLYAHLFRDPASGRLMKAHAPRVADWVERMRKPTPRAGELVAEDAVPDTLLPLLERMFREQGPVLASTLRALASFVLEPPEAPLPRKLGTHTFRIGDAVGERAISSFNLWRWQRADDEYQAFSDELRACADAILERVGGIELAHTRIETRLERKQNRLFRR